METENARILVLTVLESQPSGVADMVPDSRGTGSFAAAVHSSGSPHIGSAGSLECKTFHLRYARDSRENHVGPRVVLSIFA